jgi:hypothetical protein
MLDSVHVPLWEEQQQLTWFWLPALRAFGGVLRSSPSSPPLPTVSNHDLDDGIRVSPVLR